jgi:hypothetical protein
MDAYLAYQHEAQQEGAGVWSQADYAEKDGVCIDTINPFSETVTITNYGDSSVNMSSWSLHDEAQKTYVFPAGFVIQAGASVTIHSEDGINTPQSLYWDSDSNVWNNDSDSATLVDGNGDVVDVFTY